MILDSLPQHIKRAARLFLSPFSAEFQHLPAMELKILLITVFFLGASVAYSLQEEQEGKRAKLCIKIVFVISFGFFLCLYL